MKKTLTIRLGEDQIKTLKEIATADDRSVSAIIRRMINECIKKENTNKKMQ